MKRFLYLVAYDVCEPRRLARLTRYFYSYRVAGQKSVPEIWVTPAELERIHADLDRLVDAATDRVQIIALDPRMQRHYLGPPATFAGMYFSIT